MSFELAAVIVVACLAVVLGLVCYYLLGRLEMLERSVQGGIQPPSTRLSREQFERRFKTAHARSQIAAEIGTGILLVVGPEHADSELAATVAHLVRPDLVSVRVSDQIDAESLGVTVTPYLFIIDDGQLRNAQPVVNSADLTDALKQFT